MCFKQLEKKIVKCIIVFQNAGENSAVIENGITAPVTQHVQVGPRTSNENNGGTSLDLTLGIAININNASEAIIFIDDSESDADGDSGGFGSDPFF